MLFFLKCEERLESLDGQNESLSLNGNMQVHLNLLQKAVKNVKVEHL